MKRDIITMSILLIVLAFGQADYKDGNEVRLSPRLLNYQGYLTDTLSNPITNPSVSMVFAIYDAVSSGSQKWAETQSAVSVNKGIFHVLLGSVTPIPDSVFNNIDRWLQLTVAGQTLAPRTRIVSAPYAYTATYSDTAAYARTTALDNRWVYRITDGADTTLQTGGRWGIARFGSVLNSYSDSTHVNLGVACTTGVPGYYYKYCTVAGGRYNAARMELSAIGGGDRNTATGYAATVGGGKYNVADGYYAVICGGDSNTAAGWNANVGGGWLNSASGNCAVLAGGALNTGSAPYSAIGGGGENTVNGPYSTIGGGRSNSANADYAAIGGGLSNSANASYATVAGGDMNIAGDTFASVVGGFRNTADGKYAIAGGGFFNLADGDYSAVLNGYADTIAASGDYSYLFGINSNLTQDSTFMVDMPHVWFGTEANGYEFPRSRGANGQVMITNGAGILSWGGINYVDSARIAGNAHKLQGKDTVALDGRYVNEGQAAGGDLTGTYPNPTIANDAVNSAKILDGAIVSVDIRDTTITAGKIKDGAVTMPKIAQAGATTSQVIKWNGSAWQPASDSFRDNDWTFLISDGADTVLQMGGRWGLARPGNGFIGARDSTHVNFGVACTTGNVTLTNKYCTIAGGYSNRGYGGYSSIGGGLDNWADDFSTVGGGSTNTAGNSNTTVAGGVLNVADGSGSSIGGGANNVADGAGSTISGGDYNTADSSYAVVGGGHYNESTGYSSTTGGGQYNTASGRYSTVSGGASNTASSISSSVGGGSSNTAGNEYSTVAGGTGDTASGYYSSVGGGQHNVASDYWTTVGGGYANYASNNYATIPGGRADTASGQYSFATNNNSSATHTNSAVFNGQSSTATGETRVGVLSKAGGSFTIDHPLDPENKILNHYFVESPDMSNMYSGSVVLDGNGQAKVDLPDYFDALNKNPRVQLTGVGSSEVYVAEDVQANRFAIGGKPGMKVYWTVIADRNDPSAEIIRNIMPVEQIKEGVLAGRSLDDEFLVVTKEQLESMGKADGFKFRHASEQARYEEMKRDSK